MTESSARAASRPQRPLGQRPFGQWPVGERSLLNSVFQVLYGAGCVLAMTWVRRRNLFAPLVQPPLLLAVAVPAIVLMGDGGTGGGSALLSVGAPLINSFPTMAITSGVVLALGVLRLVVQREPRAPRDDDRGSKAGPRTISASSALAWSSAVT